MLFQPLDTLLVELSSQTSRFRRGGAVPASGCRLVCLRGRPGTLIPSVRSACAPAAGVPPSRFLLGSRVPLGVSGLSRPRQRVARPQGTRALGSRGVIWDSVVWGTRSAGRGPSRGSVGMLVLR